MIEKVEEENVRAADKITFIADQKFFFRVRIKSGARYMQVFVHASFSTKFYLQNLVISAAKKYRIAVFQRLMMTKSSRKNFVKNLPRLLRLFQQ